MRNGYSFLIIVILITLISATTSFGQVDTTQSLVQQYIESIDGDSIVINYMQPFATAFGTAINTGIYHTAKIHGIPGFDFGIRAILIPIPDEALTFRAPLIGLGLSVEDSVDASTVFGPKQSQNVYPPGLDIGRLPFGVLHLSVGLPMGTELNLRYLPSFKIKDDIPKIELLGFGLSHSIDQYFPVPIPLLPQLSAGFMYQTFKVKDLIKSTHTALNLRLSKSVPMLTVYLGAQFESSDMDITYKDFVSGGVKTLELEGENDIRFTGGFRFTIFPLLGINADYSTGKYSAFNIGLNFSFDPPGIPVI
ncbi:MAG: hypothetical protein IIA58_00360 [Candidatus Marinimicrobia bacterium]|nr:hypothetical protein [Candidatus Neomarinimicrobiota bacterium]